MTQTTPDRAAVGLEQAILSHHEITQYAGRIVQEVEKVIVGKNETVVMAVTALICNGHLLLEDIPGVGKTTLAKALARSIGGAFHRVQFTPDLLPADVTGSSVYNQRTAEFEFRPGPIFGNVVLVDEINRATPKTQSALLEAMEERQVTSDGVTRRLPEPFFVIATQNSVEMTGTYPLPEAQLDRFFARLSLGYPDRDAETAILDRQQLSHPIENVTAVVDLPTLVSIQKSVQHIGVKENVKGYIVDVVRATRDSNQLLMGASPRGSLFLLRAAQAHAALEGQSYVDPDNVKAVAPMVLAHRVLPRAEARVRGATALEIVDRILQQVPVPTTASLK